MAILSFVLRLCHFREHLLQLTPVDVSILVGIHLEVVVLQQFRVKIVATLAAHVLDKLIELFFAQLCGIWLAVLLEHLLDLRIDEVVIDGLSVQSACLFFGFRIASAHSLRQNYNNDG